MGRRIDFPMDLVIPTLSKTSGLVPFLEIDDHCTVRVQAANNQANWVTSTSVANDKDFQIFANFRITGEDKILHQLLDQYAVRIDYVIESVGEGPEGLLGGKDLGAWASLRASKTTEIPHTNANIAEYTFNEAETKITVNQGVLGGLTAGLYKLGYMVRFKDAAGRFSPITGFSEGPMVDVY